MSSVQRVIGWIALILIIVGALNWGAIGAFHYNFVGVLFGDASLVTRVIYILIGLAGLYKIFLIGSKKL